MTTPAELLELSAHAQRIRVDESVVGYVVDLARRTREDRAIELGASPRASIAMMKAAQVVAASEGRTFVTPDASFRNARAIAIRWRWPPDRRSPRSPTWVA